MKKKPVSTPLIRRFINEYLIDFNGSRAAIRAGYSPQSARSTASELIKRADVQQAIELELGEHQRRCRFDRKRIMDELAKIAFCNSTAFIGPKRKMLDVNEVSAADRAAVKGIKGGMFGLKLEFHDKTKALELLARMEGFIDQDSSLDSKPRAIVQVPGLKLTAEP
jgi:phage terminase small subunit